MLRYKLGVDVGGTFTDGVLLDEASGKVVVAKVPSTPDDSSVGFLNAIDRIIERYGVDPKTIDFLVHGTTVATNTVIEGKTAKTAFVTTRGFKDILEIAFQIRSNLYDIFTVKPTPLVPRNLCFEVKERMGHDGEVIEAVSGQDVYEVIDNLKKEQVEAVVICFLHCYANNKHELDVLDVIRKEMPDLYVTISSDICNEFKEYTRASTAVINGSIIPIVGRYIDRIEQGLRKRNIMVDCHLMQSSGGIISSQIARTKPAYIVESGPAAGVIVAQYIGELTQTKDMLALDIGGTTAKVGMILDGQPRISHELEVGSAAFARSTAKRASGYPLRTPSVDLVEIGSGGGSIAWVDSGGILRVGPQSAGASPGPACYPEGGQLPTLTDANVVLGRLNPEYFLGGEMKLNKEAAYHAIKDNCADKIGNSVVETAAGIIAVTISNMVNAVRCVTIERGYDPREFSLVTTGGAGPLHGNLLAREIGIPRVIVPKNPGLACALGLLVTDIKQEQSATVANIRDISIFKIESILSELKVRLLEILDTQKINQDQIEIKFTADMRYVKQSYEIPIQFNLDNLSSGGFEYLNDLFHQEHKKCYGFSVEDEKVKIVNLTVLALGKIKKHIPATIKKGSANPEHKSLKQVRKVFLEETGGFTECNVFDRDLLLSDNIIAGPAIVEEIDSTTVILPNYEAYVDIYGNLIISKQ